MRKSKKDDVFFKDIKIISDDITNAMQTGIVEPSTRGKTLRSSGLPYCGTRELNDWLSFLKEGGDWDDWNFSHLETRSLMFMGIGTVLHELLQNTIAPELKNVSLIGNWDAKECKKSSCPHRKNRITEMDKSGCLQCGKHLPYRELFGKSSYSSHIDFIFRINGTNRVYFPDLKTTSLRKIWNYTAGRGGLPEKKHTHQLDSYVLQFENEMNSMGLEVMGSFVWYLPRDDPAQWKMVPVRKSYSHKEKKKLAKSLDGQARSFETMTKVIGIDSQTKPKKIESEDLDQLLKDKLCSDSNYYKTRVHESYSVCPLKDICFTSKMKTHMKKVRKEANKKISKMKDLKE